MPSVESLRAAVEGAEAWRGAARALLGRGDVEAAEMRKHLDAAEV